MKTKIENTIREDGCGSVTLYNEAGSGKATYWSIVHTTYYFRGKAIDVTMYDDDIEEVTIIQNNEGKFSKKTERGEFCRTTLTREESQ